MAFWFPQSGGGVGRVALTHGQPLKAPPGCGASHRVMAGGGDELSGVKEMRWAFMAIVVLGVCVPGSAQAVATRVLPAARHDATAARWRRMVEIRYLSGRVETAYVEWIGLGDSVSGNARYLNVFTLKPIPSRDMIGATVRFVGEAYPVR